MKISRYIFLLAAFLLVSSCYKSNLPDSVKPINNFDVEKYMGRWYEIARIDHWFEANLDRVTADYSIREDDCVKVINSGFNIETNELKTANGKAKFVSGRDIAALKVSFFGPFYAAYNVVKLNTEYKYALIIGPNLDYVWILSRTKTMPEDILNEYFVAAKHLGVDMPKLHLVKQE